MIQVTARQTCLCLPAFYSCWSVGAIHMAIFYDRKERASSKHRYAVRLLTSIGAYSFIREDNHG